MREEMQKKKESELEKNNINSEEDNRTYKNDNEHLNDISMNNSGKYNYL